MKVASASSPQPDLLLRRSSPTSHWQQQLNNELYQALFLSSTQMTLDNRPHAQRSTPTDGASASSPLLSNLSLAATTLTTGMRTIPTCASALSSPFSMTTIVSPRRSSCSSSSGRDCQDRKWLVNLLQEALDIADGMDLLDDDDDDQDDWIGGQQPPQGPMFG
ncbi:hypothetical protein ACA910_016486 [Epithemia clementina (nom. ined.)]